MPLLEIAWFETVVAAQRDKNLLPEADEAFEIPVA